MPKTLYVEEASTGYLWPYHSSPYDYDPDGDRLTMTVLSDTYGSTTVEGNWYIKYMSAKRITSSTTFTANDCASSRTSWTTVVCAPRRGLSE